MLTEAIIIALITGACAIIGNIIVSNRNANDLYAKLDKQSEIADERIKGELKVVHTEISALTEKVEKHNSVIERTYNLEKEVAKQGEQIKNLFTKSA